MRLLLDTHVLFWALLEKSRLSATAQVAVGAMANEVHVSITSAWEMSIKVGLGKWPEAAALVDAFESEVTGTGFRILPISLAHVRLAGLMQSPHRDPFDRLLAAQATIEGLTLVTADSKVQSLGAPWLW